MDLFIEAVAAARRENPEIRGYVAGEGSEHERLERLADGSGVTLLGVRRDVLELIRGADALCLPSEAEALPMSILEAMALERPVVATDVGGTAEQVVDGETGHLVPAGDPEPVRLALLALAADPAARQRDGRGRAAAPARALQRRAMVDRYERVLSEAVERGRGLTSCWCRSAPRSAGAWPTRCCSSSCGAPGLPPPSCPSAEAPRTACAAAIRSTTSSRCTRRGARSGPPSSVTSRGR